MPKQNTKKRNVLTMKFSELRIGNLLQFNNLIQAEKVIVVEWWFFPSFIHLESEVNNQYKPIPLTTEWIDKADLKRFPFIIYGDNQRGFHIATENDEWIFIESVHKLQNLYFALTGEELQLKID